MKADFFQLNRDRLAASIHGGVAVFAAYSAMQQSNDASFKFEQEANFWWLCGIEEPDWLLIIDGSSRKSWLVMPGISDVHQAFDGSLSPDVAKKTSGVDEVISEDEATAILHDLSKKHSSIYSLGDHPSAKHFDFVINPAQRNLWVRLGRQFSDIRDCRLALSRLRAIKQPEEVVAIKKAIELTITAFQDVKIVLPDLKTEYEVEAEFSYAFRRGGAAGHAYEPIVAVAKNAVTLHYNKNADTLEDHSLLLLDIGARHFGYAADITRTYAVGTPTDRQKAVHAAVVRAHLAIIKLLGPGVRVSDYHESVDVIMKAELSNLGLLNRPEAYRTYFPHAISHGLGIDVHDSLGGAEIFQPGMVLTVEPGIYIPEEGIGVRIEDDILITEVGYENLSARLPISL